MNTLGNTTRGILQGSFEGFAMPGRSQSEERVGNVHALQTTSVHHNPFFNLSGGESLSVDEEGDILVEQLSVNGSSVAGNESDYVWDADDLLYRHSLEIAVLLCFSYVLVFILGLVGNCFVIAVVFSAPHRASHRSFGSARDSTRCLEPTSTHHTN
ncbi:Neuropeptide SIFamide receptor [Portunus trituberculatus]|uniref:Neuropeptide SIFamide receptor n=1 Tax=Portunus trituberculatus TaxID=210409 RepID=A0A5B7I151_PORTR|nr:Neuropeptide SIFamide receptor [Portunus trituberculatus]